MADVEFRFPQTGTRASRAHKEFVRAYMACEPCRKTKAKCQVPDPNEPCVKCRRERRECFFSAERSTNKRRKTDRSARSEQRNSSEEQMSGDAYSATQNGTYRAENAGEAESILPANFNDYQTAVDQPQNFPINVTPQPFNHAPGSQKSNTVAVSFEEPIRRQQASDRPSGSIIDSDVMRTVVSSSNDALGLLFKAAEQQENSDGSYENQENANASQNFDSPASAITSGAVPAPLLPSALSSPRQAIIEVWDACRFIKQGWFSAREAVTYIDHFFVNLATLSPVVDSFYSHHENHKSLIHNEPLLCCTLLMISSRYHILPGPGGLSRAHFIHMRLWKHCEHLIQRITFGQEKYSVAKSRTMGSIESLLLMTEWHPRALHFPPENDGWDPSLAPSVDDTYGSPKRNEDAHLIRWREEVFEPAKRSDRMSWMLLGLATTLAHELGVFEDPEVDSDVEDFPGERAILSSKLRMRRLLFIYVNQLASRLGCKSLLSQVTTPSITYPAENSEQLDRLEKDRQTLITLWIDITKLLKTATEMFFPSKTLTRRLLKSGRYVNFLEHFQPLLAQWHTSFLQLQSNGLSNAYYQVLNIDYQYVRMYINSLAIQALVERMSDRDNPNTEFNYDFFMVENSQDYKFVQEVTDASRQILQVAIKLADTGMLRYAPVRVFLRITSASIFLLKSISLGAHNTELQKSLDILDKCIQALRSSTIDDIHLSSRYGMLIERHVKRFRHNFRVQSRLGPSRNNLTAMPQTSNTLANGDLLAVLGGRNIEPASENFSTSYEPDPNFPMDDWLAQPFDPSIAPFGMGIYQSTSGFEMGSLDFLLHMKSS